MKTLKTTFQKIIILILAITISSCETEIPESDTTAPTFLFRITGDGFTHDFTNEDDFNSFQLNLKNDTEYDFIYQGSDQGGVKLIQWQLLNEDYFQLTSAITSPWTLNTISPLIRIIEWQGDSSNPLTSGIINGSFIAKGDNISDIFRFYVSDFGGQSGTSNSVSKQLNIYTGNHSTEILQF